MLPERFFDISTKKLRVAVADHASGRKFRPLVFVLLGQNSAALGGRAVRFFQTGRGHLLLIKHG
jgi:hypothetical protein